MTQHCKTCRKDKDPSGFVENGKDFKTCNECRPKRREKTQKRVKITLEDCKQFAIGKNGKCLSIEYKNNKTKMKWKCSENHEWEARFHDIKNGKDQGTWCPTCGNLKKGLSRRLTIEDCKEFAISKNGKCISTEYKNIDTNMRWKCSKNHEWSTRFDKIKNKGTWCPQCGIKKTADAQRLTIAECKEFAISKNGKCISTEYKNNKTKMKWKCSEDHEWGATFHDIKNGGRWCPQCSSGRSEQLCREIFEEHFQAKFPNVRPDFLEGLELDGYNEELNTAFEYNGRQHYQYNEHFHRGDPEIFEAQKERDRKKYQICAERDIKLIIIPYQYDCRHPEQLKQFILHQLN